MNKEKIINEQITRLLALQERVIKNNDNYNISSVVGMVEKINNAIMFLMDRM